jgi:TolB-like protein
MGFERGRAAAGFGLLLMAWMVTATSIVGQVQESGPDLQVAGARVIVLPFRNISGDRNTGWIGEGIGEVLTADLHEIADADVISGEAVATALSELGLSTTGALDRSEALAVARRAGARWLVEGGYQRMGTQIRITAWIVDCETAEVVRSARINGVFEDLFALQDRILPALGSIGSPVVAGVEEGSPGSAPSPSPSVAAAATPDLGFESVPGVPPIPVLPETISRDGSGGATIRAVPLTAPLQLDGRLDEAIYTSVAPISDFIQAEPQAGAAATEKTDAWISFDDDNVYISFRCWESRPERLVATEMRRDGMAVFNDDNILFMFDTYYDRRNSVNFVVNALGGRMDGQVVNESQYNGDWNPIWDVRTARFENGWTVEAAIPFKSLRYRPGRAQVWGFNARRSNQWKNEVSYITRIPAAWSNLGHWMSSLAATVVGLEVPPGSSNLEIKPFATSNLTTDVNGAPPTSTALGSDVGVDVKYGITQNLTTDFTYNTDFAQVEADEQQVNLTRFSLFFPEKREFFLENQGLFGFGGVPVTRGAGDVPILFYSRRIGLQEGRSVPIQAGGRLTGRLGRFSLGALTIRTDEDAVSGARATNFSVMRVKRDLLRRSSVGLILTRRSVRQVGNGPNYAYGFDGTFAFFDDLSIDTYWARTDTAGLSEDDTSYRATLDYAGDQYGVQLAHLAVGEDFNPEVGFVRRDDMRRTFGLLRFSPRPEFFDRVRKFSWTGSIEYVENGAGRLETRQLEGVFGTEFESGDQLTVGYLDTYEFLPQPFAVGPGVTLPVGGYDFRTGQLAFNFAPNRKVSGVVTAEYGTFYNGHKATVGARRGRINVTPKFSVEPSYSLNRVDLVEGSFTTHLLGSRMTYTMTPSMFASTLLQYSSSGKAVAANIRFRWEYLPGSELFVVFNEQRDTRALAFPALTNRALIVKINRLIRF